MIIMLWLVLLIYCDIKTFCFLYCCSAAIIEVTPEHLPKGVHMYTYFFYRHSILTLLIRTFRSCSLLLLLVIRCALKIQVIIPGTPRHDNEVPVETTLQYVCCALCSIAGLASPVKWKVDWKGGSCLVVNIIRLGMGHYLYDQSDAVLLSRNVVKGFA